MAVCSRLLNQRVGYALGRGFLFLILIANLILAAYLTLPALRSSPFKSLGDINNKDPCEVKTGYLIAETAVIPCIVLFFFILFLACPRNNKPSVLRQFTLSIAFFLHLQSVDVL